MALTGLEVVDVPGRKIPMVDKDQAVQRYLGGESIQQAASALGMKRSTLTAELRRRGIETLRRNTWRELPRRQVVRQYEDGQSVLALSQGYGVTCEAIRRLLVDAGVAVRGRQAARRLSSEQATAEERKQQTLKANIAARGRKATLEERIRRAHTIEKIGRGGPVSAHEERFAEMLREVNVPYRREVAVGPYNMDFAIASVGVEVLGGEWHSIKSSHTHRTPYILNEGWSLVFVWSTINWPLTSYAASYVVTFAEELRRNPTSVSEYRVIRGDGQLLARGRAEDNDWTFVPPARGNSDIIG